MSLVSGLSIFTMSVSAFICIFAPPLIAAVMVKKHHATWKAFFVGAVVFIVSQPLTRMQILSKLGYTGWFTLFTVTYPIMYSLLLGLSAGIFEEGGRFIGARLFLKNELTWENGVVFGLGHGGAEALLLVGLNYLVQIINAILGKSKGAISGVPPYMFLVGGLERVLAVIAHTGMTMLVFYSLKYKKPVYLLWAVLFHTLIDSPLMIFKQVGFDLSVWGMEGFVAIFAVLAAIIIVKFKRVLNMDKISADQEDLK